MGRSNATRSRGTVGVYVIAMLLLYAVFVWAGWNGYRFIGDDTDSRESPEGFSRGGSHSGAHRFYHK